jgi:hypothetical protein
MRLPAAAALALLWAAPAGAQDAACSRDLFMTRAAMQQTTLRLEGAGNEMGAQCRAWRQHVETLRRAKSVYERCLSGAERAQQAGMMERSAGEFAGLIKERCKGR